MRKIFKYCYKLYRKFDIAPLDSSHLSLKVIIFLIWGINLLFFVTWDVVNYSVYTNPAGKFKTTALTLKLSPLALPENQEIEFSVPIIGIVSSYKVNLVIYEFSRIDRERSPPQV